jgi:alkaline phosphatase D
MKKLTYLFLLTSFILFGFVQNTFAQHPKHSAGPMLGYVEHMEVGIWYQTNSSAKIQISYWKKSEPKKVFSTSIKQTIEEEFFIAKFILTNLDYGTEYEYQISVDSKKLSFDYTLTFKTQELWQWRKDAPDFTVAMGSCLYINDTPYDRPGKPYGASPDILESIAEKKPDVMLWTGDNIYYRETDFYSKTRLEYRNRQARQLKVMQKLLATSANYAIWDDHDFGPNNSDRSYKFKDESLKLFNAYWFNPYGEELYNKGIYFDFSYNDIDFIMLDDRYYRAPNDLMDSSKTYFGEKQLTWLKDRLLNSTAPFKVVVNGNQTINSNNPYEGFNFYPKEKEALLNFIKVQKIEGVLFLTGDRHHTELLKLEQDGMYPLYEFTNSPLTSGFNANLGKEENNPLRVPGTLVNTTQNFGFMKIYGPRKNRSVTLQTFDPKGKLLWEHTINENELKFSKN